jgi:hypothetical protein
MHGCMQNCSAKSVFLRLYLSFLSLIYLFIIIIIVVVVVVIIGSVEYYTYIIEFRSY